MSNNSLSRTLLLQLRKLALMRHDLRHYWYTRDKSSLIFFSLLAASVGFSISIVFFAYFENGRVAAERQRIKDLDCLARNIYYESRGEPITGQLAVAEVTLNRVASGRFPNTVCEAVYEQRWDKKRGRYVGAFSWTEFKTNPKPKGVAWERAVAAAQRAYDGEQEELVHGALFYHAASIRPEWASTKKQVATIGMHIFYE